MGSCCTYNRIKKVKSGEIIDLVEKKSLPERKVVIITPREKKPVPHLKKLQSNPLYKRRRRKSLSDMDKNKASNFNIPERKRLTVDGYSQNIRKKIIMNTLGINDVKNAKISPN